MKNEEILKKAIEKAVKGGYKRPNWGYWFTPTPNDIIFSHDFAKAFWGEEIHREEHYEHGLISVKPVWKYHLQQMVLEQYPLKYLEKYL